VASLDRVDADPDVRAFYQAVTSSLAGEPVNPPDAPLDIMKVTGALRGHLVLNELLDTVVLTATAAASDKAHHMAASERNSYLLWALGAAGLALASVAVALWLARTIAKPLKELAGYAHAVNEGQLDADPFEGRDHGPRETRLAFEVFTDLVANLRLLDAKANALAQCDLEDPVLRRPLPGRLGRSLESSVAVLSGSIVERDALQTHLAHLATHDSLTGIFNRPAAISAIEASMQRAARTGATTAVLFVDLNEFKAVNDSHGHEVGDEVLRHVANRLTTGLRGGDVVARLGGDEFVVVAEAVADEAEAIAIARRIVESIDQTIEVGTLRIHIGAAVGIALSLDGPEEPLRLLARADAAMYRAKLHECSGIEIFDAGLQRQMLEREDTESALTAALADPAGGGLRLQYQPILDTSTGALVGAEALVRWDRPGRGTVQPDSFVPIAEATTLIIDLDCWVLAEAARQLAAWSAVPEVAAVPVAVNISGRHLLSRQLPGHIRAVLDQSGVDPSLLTIEITETVLLSDLVTAADELDAVRALGVKVAVDDFGTGYTSLAHLQRLPIDIIKIDRTFITDLDQQRGSSLVRMVTDLGHAIDLTIIAEGVETGDELRTLQELGADHVQGFLLGVPIDPAALPTWAGMAATGVG
jgi:diguanylate cyclase (GGDEF)-like protein